MKLIQSFLTKNPCYTAGRKITVKGLMLHSVGCPQPRASVFINSWNSPSFNRACVHGFIDGNDGTVYQTLPWNHRGWHGGGSSNNSYIGVEMCEPGCIKYTGGSSFTCSDLKTARAVAQRTYDAAVELFAMLCKEFGLNPLGDGVIVSHAEGHKRGIASNHGDPEHLWRQLGMSLSMDGFRKAVKAQMAGSTESGKAEGTQATALKSLADEAVIARVGALFTADQKKSGILASISLAQFILESGYGKSELAQGANNCFGMKMSLSGNTWGGSTWDGKSVYTKETKEQNKDGSYETITADFRKYGCIEDSIADHSAYLLGAKNGSKLRYEGLKDCTDYRKVAQIIKDGGYATSLTYVEKLCGIIERWGLNKYDASSGTPAVDKKPADGYFRVRKSWADAKSQIGAYKVLANAKRKADENPGYSVFDASGKVVYSGKGAAQTAFAPYLVRVNISNLNIRKGPSLDYDRFAFTGKGCFTIVDEAKGRGASKWGLLKSYKDKRNGWISLDHVEKI